MCEILFVNPLHWYDIHVVNKPHVVNKYSLALKCTNRCDLTSCHFRLRASGLDSLSIYPRSFFYTTSLVITAYAWHQQMCLSWCYLTTWHGTSNPYLNHGFQLRQKQMIQFALNGVNACINAVGIWMSPKATRMATCTVITEADFVKMGKMWCSQPSVVSSSDVVLSSIYAHIGNNLCNQSRNTGWKYKVHKKVLLI